jgi:hypothetical protein
MKLSIPISYIYNSKGRKQFLTLEDRTFYLSDGSSIKVPYGFQTDLVTSPRFIWPIIPPFGNWINAAILHDYLYVNRIGTRKKADKEFLLQLEKDGVKKWIRYIMYGYVRLLGWFLWNDFNKMLKK